VAPSQSVATAVLTAGEPGKRSNSSAVVPDADPRPPTSSDIPLGLSGF
jgi:hypothetical protein